MKKNLLLLFLSFTTACLYAQQEKDSLLTIDRIYNSGEFAGDYQRPISWIDKGEAFVTVESNDNGEDQLERYESKNYKKSTFLTAAQLTPAGKDQALRVEDFTLSPDESKVLIFTNSSRVWRSNTKGDFWVFDLNTGKLQQIGKKFPSSSLMFAKFSKDNSYVAYVQGFNIYKENFETGEIKQLTSNGSKDIINGTFDWVYEEEFGKRDGFKWNSDASEIAFWELDASEIGTFYMINNTDSVYSKPIALQYPKVGYDPSSAKVAVVNTDSGKITWIPIPGDPVQHYIPAMQWVGENVLLIQQLNRKQNELDIYTYNLSSEELQKIYTEKEDTWVDINYLDISSSAWGQNEVLLTDDHKSFLRMTETDGWRHLFK
ncbi:MAG: DPP IV N-terminal domain-containing protein, partial [Gillisia sp.]